MKKSRPKFVRVSWWHRRIHPVFLISGLSCGILAGALLAKAAPSEWFVSGLWWFVWCGWLTLIFWRGRRWGVLAVCMVGIMVGYGRGASELIHWPVTKHFPGEVVLEGVVREDPERGSGDERRLRVDGVRINDNPYKGVYWVTVVGTGADTIERSDGVSVRGELREGFGTYAATMYRAHVNNVTKQARADPMLGVRNAFSEQVDSMLPEPASALGVGYLLGQKRALPADFEEALLATGLTHVVVASGYNLTILVRLSRRLFLRVSRYMATMVSGVLVVAFIGVTGMSASMSRAGLVAGLSLLAWYYGRTIHPAVILVVTAAASVLVQPSYIWGDVGWLLSFMSFAGVMFLAPLLQAYFFGEKKPGVMRQIVGETLSAQLLTLPLVLVTFGVVSNVALVANMLVLPLVPLAMLVTFVAGVAGLVVPFFSDWVVLPAYWLLHYMVWVIEWLAALPWAQQEVSLGVWGAVCMYAAICGSILLLKVRTGFSFRRVNLVE